MTDRYLQLDGVPDLPIHQCMTLPLLTHPPGIGLVVNDKCVHGMLHPEGGYGMLTQLIFGFGLGLTTALCSPPRIAQFPSAMICATCVRNLWRVPLRG